MTNSSDVLRSDPRSRNQDEVFQTSPMRSHTEFPAPVSRLSKALTAFGRVFKFSKITAAFKAVCNGNTPFKDMIDGSLHGVLVHADNRILYVNDALLRMLGHEPGSREQFVGTSALTLFAPEEHGRMRSFHKMHENGDAPAVCEVKGQHKNGRTVWLEQHVRMQEWRGECACYSTIIDIGDRKRQEELAARNTNFDILTGLPNRRLLLDRLRQSLQRNTHLGERTALMFLDLDRFNTVIETHGSQVGDQVIEVIAARLTEGLGPNQTVARIDGDKFAIILSNPESRRHIERIACTLLNKVAEPVKLENGRRAVLSCSIGITLSPNDGDNAEALLQQADMSMYQAKSDSGGSYRFFAAGMNDEITRSGQIETRLRKAIERGELHLNFQPIIDHAQGRIVSCEALARWTDPKLGVVPPSEFIPVAEDCGLIVPLGEWVLREACAFFRSCNRNGLHLDSISVNISPRQCRDSSLASQVQDILTESGMAPEQLRLEVTESVMFDDSHSDPVETLETIRELGVRISLDDFGTGYSSLSHLRRLPVDTLKIDRSFITGLERSLDGQDFVQAIVSMAGSLGIDVVCEGAETREQCDLILSFGCPLIQGYSFARPMAGVHFQRYLAGMIGIDQLSARAS